MVLRKAFNNTIIPLLRLRILLFTVKLYRVAMGVFKIAVNGDKSLIWTQIDI